MQTQEPIDTELESQTGTAVDNGTAAAPVEAAAAETVEIVTAEPAETSPAAAAAPPADQTQIDSATGEPASEETAQDDGAAPAPVAELEAEPIPAEQLPASAPAAELEAQPVTEAPAVTGEPGPIEASALAGAAASPETAEADPAAIAELKTEATPAAPNAKFDPGAAEALIAEVEAAPHKVYHLGKVRKALAGAGESELGQRLKALEAEVLAQIESRKAAKEALCEKAEALQESTAWKVTGEAYKALFEEWRTIGAAGRQLDDELWARFNAARGAFNERRSQHFAEREQIWKENKEKKEALCAEAEALADSTDWKATAEKIRDLQARWKEVGSAGRERDEALWARFNGAKQRFFDNRAAVWEENRKQKEGLVLEAEALKDSDDWRTVGDAMKAMQATWKTIGPAGREHEDELWRRFRAATQAFFDRRGAVFAERHQAERENLSSKVELCERAEALVYTGDPLAAAREAKELQARWKETGPVPREQSEALWQRFRAACDKIFENASGERDRQQNEWHTRMREALARKREQMIALKESIAHDEANMERWRDSLSNLKPGGKSEEIGKSLEDKILDVMNRIREKQGRVEDLRASITDIEAKLRE